jgi:hypothetical protein
MAVHACKECGNPRPPLAVEHGDEFCSTTCARRYYGTAQERPADRGVVIRVPNQLWKRRLRQAS